MLLETKRLALFKFTKEDASFLFELVHDPKWIKHIGNKSIHSLLDAEKYIESTIIPCYETLGFGLYVVKLKGQDTAIGLCGLLKRDWMEHVEIGYGFLTLYRRKGYAIEASTAIQNYAKVHLGIGSLAAITGVHNEKSNSLLDRLGMHFNRLISYPGETKKYKLYLNKG